MRSVRAGLLILLLLVLLRWEGPALAEEAHLSDIVVTNTRDHLLLYFTVDNCFTPEMNEAIESGLTTTFTFYAKLYEKRDLLWNKKIADLSFSHSIKYDNLTGTYELKLSERNDRVVTVRNFDEAKKMMAEVVALKLIPLHHLKKGARYQILMMAELDKVELPLYLHYILFFLYLWDFKTDWYAVDFRY